MEVLKTTGTEQQAHHIIPWAFKDSDIVQKAAKSRNAFHMNEALNGIPLPSTNHLTGHNSFGGYNDTA
ncbi:MAG: AHH domain-containing protein [Flavobacteriaceae bacterium]|nr:AHH domain-containing protein [Flavobacteriaceae bacterium]